MRLQYISDIHLEHMKSFPRIEKHGNILALLGDIGNPMKDNYQEFLKYCSDNWECTLLLAGNHEYWSKYNMEDINSQLYEVCNKFNNVIFLNNDSIQINEYNILGTTLWSKTLGRREFRGNDLIKIKGKEIGSIGLNELHNTSVKWLQDNIHNSSNMQTIILSHYLPTFKLIIDKYKNYPNTNRFVSDLEYLMVDPVKFWLSGHSHCNFNVQINNVFCGINAYSYNRNSSIIFEKNI